MNADEFNAIVAAEVKKRVPSDKDGYVDINEFHSTWKQVAWELKNGKLGTSHESVDEFMNSEFVRGVAEGPTAFEMLKDRTGDGCAYLKNEGLERALLFI